MSRRSEFDKHQALENATHLFWEKGYSNTSLRDLLAVMNIGQGSFYHFVEGKKELYLKCLIHYNATVTKRRWELLANSKSFHDGIRAFFTSILDDLNDPKTPNICLMAGSLANDVMAEHALSDYIIAEMAFLENALAERIEIAKQVGELSKEANSKIIASIIVTFLQGFFRVVRLLKSREEMQTQIDALLDALHI